MIGLLLFQATGRGQDRSRAGTDEPSGELLKPTNKPGDRPGGSRSGGRPGGRGGSDPRNFTFRTEVPAHPFDIVLARPSRDSITASVRLSDDGEGRILYGTQSGTYEVRTPLSQFRKGEPLHLRLDKLTPDTRYVYRLEYRPPGGGPLTRSEEFAFHTARAPGADFVFTVQADAHLDFSTVPQIYTRTLANALGDKPDFHVDLGDTFMTDKYPRYTDAEPQYAAQRYYFGLLCHSAPLFLVPGNHDGESASRRGGAAADPMAVWSNQTRKRYFANPYPDGFYGGNTRLDPAAGRLEDYYAWEWGDALFVVLDPFWYTTRKGRTEEGNWNRSLGREQYDWLRRTLEASRARFKFVFLHHLVGGFDKEGRGGIEAAGLFEWGGRSADGRAEFESRRPGWGLPIHELLVKHRVSAVFHGHDHLYVRQELDGIVYLEVPQPSHPGNNAARSAAEYGYTHGTVLSSPGHVRVRVSAARAAIEYVRSRQPSEAAGGANGAVIDSVAIPRDSTQSASRPPR